MKVWNQSLQPVSFFQLTQHPSLSPVNASIGSVDIRFDDGSNLVVLVGTYGGEIIEICAGNSEHNTKQAGSLVGLENTNFDLSAPTLNVHMHSHYSGELWGLASHPKNDDCLATVGDDATLRLWSIRSKRMTSCTLLGWPARSVAWNPNGDVLAVGFHELTKGGASSKGKKGSKAKSAGDGAPAVAACVVIFLVSFQSSTPAVTELCRGGSSVAWISDLKFSPSGRILAVGSHDKKIYLYDTPDTSDGDWSSCLSRVKFGQPYNKHSSAITHFDFSMNEKYLQSNCQAYELLFLSLSDGKQETSASKLADYNNKPDGSSEFWSTWTCTLGWPVQGIWPPGADGTDINAVDRSPSNSLLATADDFGLIKLFRYPCATEKAKFNAFTGHSSHVTCVRWSQSGQFLLSTGGNDKCLFVWQIAEK